MKKIAFLLFAFLFASCGSKNNSVSISEVLTNDTTIKAVAFVPMDVKKTNMEFSNPALMAGSDFGSFFLSMLKTQNYNMAMSFISKESLDKYGKDAVLSNLKSYSYNYALKLASVDANTSVLKFTTNEFATGKFKTMRYVVENDTCKVVLSKKLEIFGNE